MGFICRWYLFIYYLLIIYYLFYQKDYNREYTWDKFLETGVKSVGILAGKSAPTVVSPKNYRERFRMAMDRYKHFFVFLFFFSDSFFFFFRWEFIQISVELLVIAFFKKKVKPETNWFFFFLFILFVTPPKLYFRYFMVSPDRYTKMASDGSN